MTQTLPLQDTWRLPPWLEGSSFQQALVAWPPTPDMLFEAVTGEQGQLVLPAVQGFTQGIGGVVSGAFVVLFLSLYWSINQIHFERLWLSLLPAELRKHTRGIWRAIEHDLGAYIRSEIIQSLLAVLLLGLGYWLVGSPYPALLAVVGALAWPVPVVGAALAVILPLLLGLLTGAQFSLFTVLYRSRFPVGAGQESLPVSCFHLYLRFEPGVWLCGSDDRISCLGISEWTHLSLWRLLKRGVFPTRTAAKRTAGGNPSVAG